jgi:hypothetical protein
VTARIEEVVAETATLSDANAIRALVAILGAIERGAEGEVHKAVVGCSGVVDDIASSMEAVVRRLSEDEKQSLTADFQKLEGLAGALEEYGVMAFEEILPLFRDE